MNNKIVPIIRKNTSCDYHRILLPFSEMGYDVNKQIPIKDANLVIFNRVPNISIENFLNLKKLYGFKYIIDIDDFWELEPDHYLHLSFKKYKMSDKIIKGIQHAEAVITTTSILADKIRYFNKNVHVIHNALPFDSGQFKMIRSNNQKTKFIYAGGHSHYHDVQLISDSIAISNCHFTLAGYNSNNTQSINIKNLLHNNIFLLPEQDLNNYMKIYNGIDVSLVPLVKNNFNECKSELKILEAGCKGLAVIASKTLPYYNEQDKNVIDFAENRMDWVNKIRYFMQNKNYLKERKQQLAEHTRQYYNLENANKYRKQLFDHLLS